MQSTLCMDVKYFIFNFFIKIERTFCLHVCTLTHSDAHTLTYTRAHIRTHMHTYTRTYTWAYP